MLYNDGIIDHQVKIIDAIDSLENSFEDYRIDKMKLYRNRLDTEISQGISFLNSVGSYDDDASLIASAKILFETYKQLSDHDYPIIIEVLSMPDSLFSEQDQQRLFDQQTIVNDKITKAHNDFLVKQKAFGKRHHLVFTQE